MTLRNRHKALPSSLPNDNILKATTVSNDDLLKTTTARTEPGRDRNPRKAA
jgi:hypothetical protein